MGLARRWAARRAADRGVIREAGGRGRRGTTGLRVMVGAGLRAVGVQRRDEGDRRAALRSARAWGVWGGPHARRSTTRARHPVLVTRGRPPRGGAMYEGLKAVVFEGATTRTGAALRLATI